MNQISFRFIYTATSVYEEMVRLRIEVLLEPIGVPSSYIDPEREAADVMIGAFADQQLIGCCILTEVNGVTVQLRQMAVDSSYQGKSIGTAIVSFAEKVAREKGYQTLMMHARDAVIPFYEKCGYQIYGEPFSEVGIGHHRMEKKLTAFV